MLSTRLTLWALGYGLLIWFEAALTIRFLGDYIFLPSNLSWMTMVFVGTALLAFTIGWFNLQLFQTTPPQRAASALLICAVGLLGNTLVLMMPALFFPAMTTEQLAWFAAWFAWGYGVGLLSGVLPRRLPWVPVD
jgi:hypothetical protein